MVNYSEPSPQSRPAPTSLIKASLRIIKIHSCSLRVKPFWQAGNRRRTLLAVGSVEMVLLKADRNKLFSHLARQIVINTTRALNLARKRRKPWELHWNRSKLWELWKQPSLHMWTPHCGAPCRRGTSEKRRINELWNFHPNLIIIDNYQLMQLDRKGIAFGEKLFEH